MLEVLTIIIGIIGLCFLSLDGVVIYPYLFIWIILIELAIKHKDRRESL